VRVLVSGVGAVGARAARHLVADAAVEAVEDADPTLADLVLLASPPPRHVAAARRAVAAGRHVVSVADSVAAVEDLLDLHAEARERKVTVAVGAGFGPGLSCVLARHAAGEFDTVDEIHVAHQGTGGPACARQHHSALRGVGFDWRDHTWRRRPPGSGRELCFFPDPIGGADCYRAALPDALLLVPAFPGVARVTARLAATRRDRLTAGLPMLRPPHAEGRIGGLRVEVRGRRGSTRDTLVLGAVDRPAVAAGTVAAVTARWVGSGQASGPGAAGLATLVEPLPFLHELGRAGVRAAVFEGI
jgi:hypothetical protein